jgi:DnaJ-domain-containing protein 1
MVIYIKYCANGDVALQLWSSDSDEFFEAIYSLKQHINPRDRKYSAERRTWHISWSARPSLNAWLTEMCRRFDVEIERSGRSERQRERAADPRPKSGLKDAYTTLHLLPSAPPEVVKAAYRALAQLHHPDRGGDEEKMKRVNLAYEALCRREEAA